MGRTVKNAAIIYIVEDQGMYKTLLLKLNYGDRGWASPGGGIDAGEDSWTAAKREMMEETGIIIECDKPHTKFIIDKTMIYIVQGPERCVKLSDEHVAYTYIPLTEVTDVRLTEYARDAFTLLLRTLTI